MVGILDYSSADSHLREMQELRAPLAQDCRDKARAHAKKTGET